MKDYEKHLSESVEKRIIPLMSNDKILMDNNSSVVVLTSLNEKNMLNTGKTVGSMEQIKIGEEIVNIKDMQSIAELNGSRLVFGFFYIN